MSGLRWIQRYFSKGLTAPPCERIEACRRRAVGMWVDADGHAHDFCELHADLYSAPPMEEGIVYAPTHS